MKTARLALATASGCAGAEGFGPLDEAVNALVAAIRAADRKALIEIQFAAPAAK